MLIDKINLQNMKTNINKKAFSWYIDIVKHSRRIMSRKLEGRKLEFL